MRPQDAPPGTVCECGHDGPAHVQSRRPGTDCTECGVRVCEHWRPAGATRWSVPRNTAQQSADMWAPEDPWADTDRAVWPPG